MAKFQFRIASDELQPPQIMNVELLLVNQALTVVVGGQTVLRLNADGYVWLFSDELEKLGFKIV